MKQKTNRYLLFILFNVSKMKNTCNMSFLWHLRENKYKVTLIKKKVKTTKKQKHKMYVL
jgi:hypothetical protein